MKKLILVAALGLTLVAGCDVSVTPCQGKIVSLNKVERSVRVAYTSNQYTYVEEYDFEKGDTSIDSLHNGETVTVYANDDIVKGIAK